MTTTIPKKSAYDIFTIKEGGRSIMYGGLLKKTTTSGDIQFLKLGETMSQENLLLPYREPCLGATPGDRVCTVRILDHHLERASGCRSMVTGECASAHKDHPQASKEAAMACRSDPATALRRLAHLARNDDADLIGSTGHGLGHLANAHAMGRSMIPIREQRFPKTIA